MSSRPKKQRVALIGAGFIASVHLAALARRRDTQVVALCDPALDRARDLARRFKIERVHGSIGELLEVGEIDVAHVLVPPDRHREATEPLLRAGVHCLVEKPLALGVDEVATLREAAASSGAALGVNHNMVFHPVVRRLVADVRRGVLGRLEHLNVVHNVPLRQLDGGDVTHFMFQAEAYILLEQAVHPLSIVQRLLGRCLEVTARTEEPLRLSNGAPFRDTWTLALRCERGTAQLFLAFGRALTETTFQAIGTDGSVRLDLQRATYVRMRKTRWLEFWDTALNGIYGGLGLFRQGLGAAVGYGLGLFKLSKKSDAYLASMGDSIDAFHDALRADAEQPCGGASAAEVIEMCAMAARAAGASWQRHERFAAPVQPPPAREGEVVVTGATGFIGRYLVPALLETGHPVTVLVRRPEFLPEFLRDPQIRVLVGDAKDGAAVRRAVEGARAVIHMATCAAGPGETAEESMRGGARAVAEACLDARVERLVFVSSTAALYLGDDQPVDGSVGPDRRPARRAEDPRGKIAAEIELRELERSRNLPLTIVRPAIVVGPGGQINHSGVGLWVRDNHCVGWGMGNHPLPFVLASDCADALAACVSAKDVIGKSYNLAGDVQLSAAEFVGELRRRTGREFSFHPQPVWSIVFVEMLKWGVKVLARKTRELPSGRDFRSRGFFARLDCRDAKRDLGWAPQVDRELFLAEAIPASRTPAPPVPAAPAAGLARDAG